MESCSYQVKKCVSRVSFRQLVFRYSLLGLVVGLANNAQISSVHAQGYRTVYAITNFSVDAVHQAPLNDPHTVFAPSYATFYLAIAGKFNTTLCYQVQIKRTGGSDCGSANSSGVDTADHATGAVCSTSGNPCGMIAGIDFGGCPFGETCGGSSPMLIAEISPMAAADFKDATDWDVEVRQRNAGCTGGSTIKNFSLLNPPIYLTLIGCNQFCCFNSGGTASLAALPSKINCGQQTQVCATVSTTCTTNLSFEWDTDGDGQYDDLTTDFSTPCITVNLNTTTTIGVRVTDNGTLITPCAATASTTVTVNQVCVDDGNPCTDAVCDPNGGCIHVPNDNNNCDDGLFCNGVAQCVGGVCVPGSPCPSDGIDCTDDSCDEVNDVCVYTPNDAHCNDGLFCNGDEICHPMTGCQPGTPPCNSPLKCDEAGDRCVECLTDGQCDDGIFCNGMETCDTGPGICRPGTDPCPPDGIDCTVDSCDEANDACVYAPNDSLCEDFNACTDDHCDPGQGGCVFTPDDSNHCTDGDLCTNDTCVGGTCVSTPVDCSGLNDDCNVGVCNPMTGMCEPQPANEGGPCDDGLYCTVGEVCTGGVCGSGAMRDCSDGVICTNDSCDEDNNVCVHLPVDAKCNDGLFCNGIETCDPVLDCRPGTPPCGDAIPCTIDECVEDMGGACIYTPDDSVCDDGFFCNGAETCDVFVGCLPGSDPCPPDGVDCTIDGCDESADVCFHTPDHGSCQNGLFCDGMEICDPMQGCIDGPDPCSMPLKCDEDNDRCVICTTDAQCDDGLYCNGLETCDTVTGFCLPGADPCPPDGVACTVDGCNEDSDSCFHTPNDAFCQNGVYCDGMEICDPVQGCLDGPDPCLPDGVDCTIDSCDEASQSCMHVPNDAACQDGLYCNGQEVCDPIQGCVDGPDPCSPDKVACTVDFCDEDTDSCQHVPNNALCDDGLFCNGAEICNPVMGCMPGSDPCPPDGISCTIDGCNEQTDSCTHDPSDALCDDGVYCNGIERCDPLLGCRSGDNVDCGHLSDACNLGICDEANDSCIAQPTNEGGKCPDDGLACTTDTCAAGQCVHTPIHSRCDDGRECTSDSCSPGHPMANPMGCVNTNLPDGTACGNTTPLGVCDRGDICVAGDCSPNLVSGGEVCRPAQGDCDLPESCTGSDPACPPNAFVPAGTVCRESTDLCDPAELCTGNTVTCPADVVITTCAAGDGCCPTGCDSGTDPDCPFEPIPTVSEWGLAVLALLLLIGAKLKFRRFSPAD